MQSNKLWSPLHWSTVSTFALMVPNFIHFGLEQSLVINHCTAAHCHNRFVVCCLSQKPASMISPGGLPPFFLWCHRISSFKTWKSHLCNVCCEMKQIENCWLREMAFLCIFFGRLLYFCIFLKKCVIKHLPSRWQNQLKFFSVTLNQGIITVSIVFELF